MWARDFELMTALFLVASNFLLEKTTLFFWSDLILGTLIVIASVLSYVKRFEKMHLLTLFFSLYLMVFGYISAVYDAPQSQNDLVIGFLLLMLAAVPTNASTPPKSWVKERNG